MDGLTQYTIKKGNHFCWPRVLKSRNRVNAVLWKVLFDKNCNYDLANSDQEDWNKVLGIYFNLLNPRDNTVMVGWRYRIPKNAFGRSISTLAVTGPARKKSVSGKAISKKGIGLKQRKHSVCCYALVVLG